MSSREEILKNKGKGSKKEESSKKTSDSNKSIKDRFKIDKERLKIDKEAFKKSVESLRGIFAKNIVITVCSVVFLLALIPFILDWMFDNIFPYTFTNIDQSFVAENETGEYTGSDPIVGFAWMIWKSLYSSNDTMTPEIRYGFILTLRLIRFLYIVILTLVIIYLVLFFILSMIMQNKLKFKAVVVSCLVGAMISLSVAFFVIPNEGMIFQLFIDTIQNMIITALNGQAYDIPGILLNVLIAFYMGFFITFAVQLISTTILQYLMREW